MISISTDKGIIRVNDWLEIISRQGFTEKLDPKEEKLESVIGNYAFGEKVKCGLKDCGTLHNKGYIVATKSGRETNIGKDCGKKYFGIDFQDSAAKFDRDYKDAENRDRLWSFQLQYEDLKTKAYTLDDLDYGAKWAYSAVREALNPRRGLPSLKNCVRNQDPSLYREVEMTKEEMDAEDVASGKTPSRPRYKQERAATLDAIDAFYPENDIRDILVGKLKTPMQDFEKLNIDELSHTELKRWAKWSDEVEPAIERLSHIIDRCRIFFNPDNLRKFELIIKTHEESKLLSSFIKKHSCQI